MVLEDIVLSHNPNAERKKKVTHGLSHKQKLKGKGAVDANLTRDWKVRGWMRKTESDQCVIMLSRRIADNLLFYHQVALA